MATPNPISIPTPAQVNVVGVAHGTGRRFESDILHLFTVVDGKVTRLLDFFDTEALTAAYRGEP